jgi:hypothetical protein
MDPGRARLGPIADAFLIVILTQLVGATAGLWPRRCPGTVRRLIQRCHGFEVRQIRQLALAFCTPGILEERQILAVITVKCFHGSVGAAEILGHAGSVRYSAASPKETSMSARGKATPTAVAIAGLSH